jgi:hypothetical protein
MSFPHFKFFKGAGIAEKSVVGKPKEQAQGVVADG